LDRRGFIHLAAGGAAAAGGIGTGIAGEVSETVPNVAAQLNPSFTDDKTTADIIAETLIA
jgi:hypothetical protein